MRVLPILLAVLGLAFPAMAQTPSPIVVGLDAEFGLNNSTSAQSIEKGILTAIDEINRSGGVLGRPMALKTSDNRSVPMRGVDNLAQFAADPQVAAVFGGRFSPVVIEAAPVAREKGILLLDPWASADGIIDETRQPAWVFRLSLRDSYAMPAMLSHAKAKGWTNVGLLLANTMWGRSNSQAAASFVGKDSGLRIVGETWFNWGEKTLLPQYRELVAAGAQAVVFVTNDIEGSLLVREMANLPQSERRPVIFHWGVTGGTFVEQCGPALDQVDHAVVQTFSFSKVDTARTAKVLDTTGRLFGVHRAEDIDSPVGFAHAYDLTHILARAIALAGSSDRAKVRDAMERVGKHQGLVRFYEQAFTPMRHEALGPEQVFMARFRSDGTLDPLP